jgi:nitrate reductase NapE
LLSGKEEGQTIPSSRRGLEFRIEKIMTGDRRGSVGAIPVLRPQRWQELVAFLVLAFGIWPIVAVGVVGGYGFLVWMWQMVNGPPGPPAG